MRRGCTLGPTHLYCKLAPNLAWRRESSLAQSWLQLITEQKTQHHYRTGKRQHVWKSRAHFQSQRSTAVPMETLNLFVVLSGSLSALRFKFSFDWQAKPNVSKSWVGSWVCELNPSILVAPSFCPGPLVGCLWVSLLKVLGTSEKCLHVSIHKTGFDNLEVAGKLTLTNGMKKGTDSICKAENTILNTGFWAKVVEIHLASFGWM